MINETLEVQDYLEGKNINKKCLYRICYLLAKYYKQQGKTLMEIRQSIFDWGKKYNIYIAYNVNNIIYQALDDKKRLTDNINIQISKKDIGEINKRFDNKNPKLVALGILCYAKCYSDSNNEFLLSLCSFANWLKLDASNLSSRYITELIDFGYISKVENSSTFKWNKKMNSKHIRFKINVPIHNDGEFVLKNNDIQELYKECF